MFQRAVSGPIRDHQGSNFPITYLLDLGDVAMPRFSAIRALCAPYPTLSSQDLKDLAETSQSLSSISVNQFHLRSSAVRFLR